jgi:hypothetical protein
LDRCFDGGRLERLVMGPLTMGASYRLLRDRVGLDLSRSEVVRLHAVTAGKKFFTVDLGREFARTNARHAAAEVVGDRTGATDSP